MKLVTEPYLVQIARWPKKGRHILASYDEETIIVYQAYRPEIGQFAASNGYFGGSFSYNRMSWIKPNFLWMMYRSGWGAKVGQEVILAIRLRRSFFEEILNECVVSSYDSRKHPSHDDWSRDLKRSSVRLQWDPDHDPTGAKVERRAIQLGLRGQFLTRFGKEEALEILDISSFVVEQRAFVTPSGLDRLVTPSEHVYLPEGSDVREKIGLSSAR